jgi:dihydrofolate synthase/folylpolyglutamate synthase
MAPVTQGRKTEQTITSKTHIGAIKTYKEVISFLDTLTPIEYSKNAIERAKQLDKLLGNISQKMDIILVGGTNGKSSTINFAQKLLREEKYKVGTTYSTHILNYNERIAINSQTIQNKIFTDIANEVIEVAQSNKIDATAFELMLFSSLLHFHKENVSVVILEVGLGGKYDATNAFTPKVVAITRIAQDTDELGDDLDTITYDVIDVAKKGCWLISAEQSKIRLNKMKKWAEDNNVKWAMPIRKLAALPYVYEQLYGRSASLGERIAQIYVEDVCGKFSPFLRGNLLATKKGQRGRPTLEAKRNAELNPIKTLRRFWSEEFTLLPGRFELLNKERPSILLDNADNIDAFANTFLGIRLLNYQHPLKDLSLVVGLSSHVDATESIKIIRYLLKKVSGFVAFVPIENASYHKPKELADIAKELGLKAKGYDSFTSAFEETKNNIDDQDGLITIIGHKNLVSKYWEYRGIKKV